MITFMDYVFTLNPDGSIVWDAELEPDQLGVQAGDRFQVEIESGNKIVFKKCPRKP